MVFVSSYSDCLSHDLGNREGERMSGNGLVRTLAGEVCSWLHVLMGANGQAKDFGLVLDERQGRFDVVIRRHFGCLEPGRDERMEDGNSGNVPFCWNKECQCPNA